MLNKQLNVRSLLTEGRYTIPLYQRNFAWTIDKEISRLIEDIYTAFEQDSESSYCLGVLTVDQKQSDIFEVVDGQQRLTTLLLIDAVLRRRLPSPTAFMPNIKFDARPDANLLIDHLYNSDLPLSATPFEHHGAPELYEAFLSLYRTLPPGNEWMNYFYEKVWLIRIAVPQDTEINKYFEVMNSRGRQLEPHEILKARFLKQIEDKTTRRTFALAWDACAQMDKPLVESLPKHNRSLYCIDPAFIEPHHFGESGDAEQTDRKDSMLDIINEGPLFDTEDDNTTPPPIAHYQSVIDFPNFLLQTLSLTRAGIPLDDRKLLEVFDDSDEPIDAEYFIQKLVRCRALFDTYVVKREVADQPGDWTLKRPKLRQDSLYFVNTFGHEEESDAEQLQILMIQTMFHVTYPSHTYKNWLTRVLAYLWTVQEVAADAFLEKLTEIAHGFYRDLGKGIFDEGLKTPRFLFNFLDYLLWEAHRTKDPQRYSADLLDAISRAERSFRNFRFIQNNSVEHISPQTPHDGSEPVSELDNLGNLCLISTSSNSRLLNRPFFEKRLYFTKSNAIESLKQAIVFGYDTSVWTDVFIVEHARQMKELLDQCTSTSSPSQSPTLPTTAG